MAKQELTPKQRKKKQVLQKKQTKLRVQKHREKKKLEGYVTINIDLDPKTKIILDRYKTMKYNDKKSYSHIVNELIVSILKRRNNAMFYQGVKY